MQNIRIQNHTKISTYTIMYKDDKEIMSNMVATPHFDNRMYQQKGDVSK